MKDWYRDPANLLMQYRLDIAEELRIASETNATLGWDEWKRLFYHWKYRRDQGITIPNESLFASCWNDIYFDEPEADIIRPETASSSSSN